MLYWLVGIGNESLRGLVVEVEPARVFCSSDGRDIAWNPLQVLQTPSPECWGEIQKTVDAAIEARK